MSRLDDVLVVTVRKSFWASPEARGIGRQLYARVYFGHSTYTFNSAVVALRALLAVWRYRPRVILLGSVERLVPWAIRARRTGLLGKAKLVVTNQLNLSDEQLAQVDRVILYARPFVEGSRPALRERAVFAYLPADGDFAAAQASATRGSHALSGGGAGRDFATVVAAARDTDVPVEIVTFSPETLGDVGELPPNVEVRWRMDLSAFLGRLASAAFAVVLLRDPDSPHGQTSVVQALALGKPVVATRSPGVVDYVRDGEEGFLVGVGDVAACRAALERLHGDDELRARMSRNAFERAKLLTYERHRERLLEILADLD